MAIKYFKPKLVFLELYTFYRIDTGVNMHLNNASRVNSEFIIYLIKALKALLWTTTKTKTTTTTKQQQQQQHRHGW